MKKNTDVRTIHIGMRKLDLIEGLTIKKYLPEGILKRVHTAMDDQGMEWTDEIIEDCTMVISNTGQISIMHKYDAIRFKGLLLFCFMDEPKHDYRFSFPLKQFHIEYYTKRKY
ncbi:hypothetical protein EJ994_14075 [Maribacter sp. MJ134]|uniref:hypothetical protein n=1 Tax=Maribacter sp. MJ134 TaxID=2496865 RepID=UPI000F84E71C|nr:hypothetical protein [Maribacter sp. MJ134]AZQ59868.1 hypothetical protein EJ994_14075 [Maribacter sp. MJ134]